MKPDISTPEDIHLLVDGFYDKVRADRLLAPLFADVDWDRHLPLMYAFWENVLFMSGDYSGNPMMAHQRVHQRTPLTREHFDQWFLLFIKTVSRHFEGEMAERACQRALSIATLMQARIAQ